MAREPREGETGDSLMDLVARAMRLELHTEPDENFALRKALLALAVLLDVHDETPEPVRMLIDYLIGVFPPLGGRFRNHMHLFYGDHEVARMRDDERGHICLAIGRDCLLDMARRVRRDDQE